MKIFFIDYLFQFIQLENIFQIIHFLRNKWGRVVQVGVECTALLYYYFYGKHVMCTIDKEARGYNFDNPFFF